MGLPCVYRFGSFQESIIARAKVIGLSGHGRGQMESVQRLDCFSLKSGYVQLLQAGVNGSKVEALART